MRRFLRSLSVVMIPSRVSATTNTGSTKTTIIASEHVHAEAEIRLGLQDVVELRRVVARSGT